MILLNSIAAHLCSNAAQSPWSCRVSWLFEVHESSWKFMISKFHECSCFLISWFHEYSHSYHCEILLTRAHGLTLFTSPLLFFGSCNTSCFHEELYPWRPLESPWPKRLCAATHCRSTVYHCDGIFRARDPNAFELPRVAETKFTTATAFLEQTTQKLLRCHSLQNDRTV